MSGALRVLAVAAAVLAFVPKGQAQIAFISKDTLYVLNCDRTGRPLPGARPLRVTRLWPETGDDRVWIGWTPSGKIWIEHYVDAWNGPKRFGPSRVAPVSGIWVVDPQPGTKPTKLAMGGDPAFSPDGSLLAFTKSSEVGGHTKKDVLILDLATRRTSSFASQAYSPVWSPKGDCLAVIRQTGNPDGPEQVQILRYPSGEATRKLEPIVDPCEIMFSPDATLLAVHFHLSRPLTGHSVFDLHTGRGVAFAQPTGYAPPTIDDWSSDGKRLLCSWRIEDPQNDGSWIRAYVALAPVGPGKARRLDLGSDALFAPDGLHVLFLTDRKAGVSWKNRLLVWRSLKPGGESVVLAKGVKEFAVMRKPRDLQRGR